MRVDLLQTCREIEGPPTPLWFGCTQNRKSDSSTNFSSLSMSFGGGQKPLCETVFDFPITIYML